MNYNEQMIHEFLVLCEEERENEEALMKEEADKLKITTFKKHHRDMADISRMYINEMYRIFGFSENYLIKTADDVVNEFRKITITPEQKKAMNKIRKEPRYRMIMGLSALKDCKTLDKVLGKELDPFLDFLREEGGIERTYKDEELLEKERQDCYDIITSLKDMGEITEEEANKYLAQLHYIYNYYVSCARGEQIPNRRYSDQEYKMMERKIGYRGEIDDERLKAYIARKHEEELEYMLDLQQKAKALREGRD